MWHQKSFIDFFKLVILLIEILTWEAEDQFISGISQQLRWIFAEKKNI